MVNLKSFMYEATKTGAITASGLMGFEYGYQGAIVGAGLKNILTKPAIGILFSAPMPIPVFIGSLSAGILSAYGTGKAIDMTAYSMGRIHTMIKNSLHFKPS
jgi:hypothetical protein